MKRIISATTLAITCIATVCGRVVTYPAPEEAPLNGSFSVEVRDGGETESAWMPVDVYNIKVDETIGGKHTVRNSSMAIVDFDGTMEVKVTAHGRAINEARVRPLSRVITPDKTDSTLTFRLDRPANLSVEINGDIFDNLQLFAGPIPTDAPTAKELKKLKKDRNFVYFAPGYHKLEAPLKVGDNQRVYMAGGSYIDGEICVDTVSNVKIWGRGIVYPARKAGISVRCSRNVAVDGIMTTQLPVGGSDSVSINNVKVISYYGWGDGLNVFASDNVSYDNVFCRNSDDCTTVYATRKGFVGGCRNIRMENSTLWADVAHPIMIGLHGAATELGLDARADTIQNLLYRNLDILDQKEQQIDYQGCLAISCGDNNVVRDVTFDGIRIEDLREGQLVNIRIFFNKKYCKAPGISVENVLFKDIEYNGHRPNLSIIAGYDETRRVSGITFDNLVINGVRISDDMPGKPKWYKTSDFANMFIGEHVDNVIFK